jgi:hypothetical protein
VKSDAIGGLKEAKGKPVNAQQMEIARLKAKLAKTRMERDILEHHPIRWILFDGSDDATKRRE